jgi:hypothetical protein
MQRGQHEVQQVQQQQQQAETGSSKQLISTAQRCRSPASKAQHKQLSC